VDTRLFDLMGYLLFPAIELLGTIILTSQVAWPVFVVFIPVIVASLWYQVTHLVHFFLLILNLVIMPTSYWFSYGEIIFSINFLDCIKSLIINYGFNMH
jgi:hypothetical protein